MNRLILLWALSALLVGGVYANEAPLEVVPWRQLSAREMSPVGRRVMRGNRRAWSHAESAELIVHAPEEELLERLAHEADWSFREIGRWLDLPPPNRPVRVFAVQSPQDWARVMQLNPHTSGGVAAHLAGEIFIRRSADQPPRYVDLAHELVHARLYREFGEVVPLWLDEGLAEYLSWRIAGAYQRRHRQLHLVRELPAVEPDEWLAWDEFFNIQDYPDDPERNRIFYRQSYEVLRFLVERLGEDHLGAFVRQVIESDRPVEQVLVDDWEWSTVEWDEALPR